MYGFVVLVLFLVRVEEAEQLSHAEHLHVYKCFYGVHYFY